jgi:death-on-curing family protein
MQIVTISISHVEYIAHRLAKELLSLDEPIPDFETRYPHRLESCLATPFLTFGGDSFYPSLISKAAMLFYLMIKNHPFQNGNKRIAVTTLLVFLKSNKKWLKVDLEELYKFTVWIAESSPRSKEGAVKAIENFIKAHLVAV